MTIHELKTWPAYFGAIWNGRKTFEVRRDDRGFQSGDFVLLREYDPHRSDAPRFPASLDDGWRYTGRAVSAAIGYVLHGVPGTQPFGQGSFNFGEHVVFSLIHTVRGTHTDGTFFAEAEIAS